MVKKVLIVESSLAVRGIAESLLRQNGYEVVAAETAAAAKEILSGSNIDLVLVASDIQDEDGQRYFEVLGADSSTAALPLLVLHDPSAGDEIAYPPEAIINKPFTPRDFLEAVSVFGEGKEANASASPLSNTDFEDALIDTALGLDKIEVDGAEVLDDGTFVNNEQNTKAQVESLIGYDAEVQSDESAKNHAEDIDSINVPPDTPDTPDTPEAPTPAQPEKATEAKPEFLGIHKDAPPKKQETLTESSKIEIVTDQFGISLPEESLQFHDNSDSGGTHDYDWFLKELRKEAEGGEAGGAKDAGTAGASGQKTSTPAGTPSPKNEPTHTQAVDKFISEFKKEMEKIAGSDTPSNIEVTNIAPKEAAAGPEKPKAAATDENLSWEEGLERVTPAEIKVISRQLIGMMAGEIAAKIVARLDEDIIYHLIKESIDNLVQRHASEKSRKS